MTFIYKGGKATMRIWFILAEVDVVVNLYVDFRVYLLVCVE